MSGTSGQTERGGLSVAKVVKGLYNEGQTDYFLEPIVVVNQRKEPIGRVSEGDTIFFCLRRGEREIQLTRAFADPNFNEFPRERFRNVTVVTLTLYHEMFSGLPVVFPTLKLDGTLGEVVSRKGLRQVRISESEKLAHVTFFFNGKNGKPFSGEDDIAVPSRKGVSVREEPEQSIGLVTEEAEKAILSGKYNLIVVNFANGDIVGHVDDRNARIKCAEAVDRHLGTVLLTAARAGYITIVTADHGVLEETVKKDGTVNVGHTANPVPFIIFDPLPSFQGTFGAETGAVRHYELDGRSELGCVAPTILEIMGIEKPPAMTSKSLIKCAPERGSRSSVMLIILDGWGIGRNDETNPIYAGKTPVWNWLTKNCPFTTLRASGSAVGLEEWKMGNSEAGHINMAAGRIVLQDDLRIDNAFRNGSLQNNPLLMKVINKTKADQSHLHLITLLSKMSSHGSVDYALAILKLAKDQDLKQVFLHLIFDGRSTSPGSAPLMLKELEDEMNKIGVGMVASAVGRGYALDRDRNYVERTKLAYDAMVYGMGRPAFIAQ